MAKTLNRNPAEPDTRTAIVDECNRALNTLSAKPEADIANRCHRPRSARGSPAQARAKSDLLKIIGSWRDDQWVLNELRRWNTKAH